MLLDYDSGNRQENLGKIEWSPKNAFGWYGDDLIIYVFKAL